MITILLNIFITNYFLKGGTKIYIIINNTNNLYCFGRIACYNGKIALF